MIFGVKLVVLSDGAQPPSLTTAGGWDLTCAGIDKITGTNNYMDHSNGAYTWCASKVVEHPTGDTYTQPTETISGSGGDKVSIFVVTQHGPCFNPQGVAISCSELTQPEAGVVLGYGMAWRHEQTWCTANRVGTETSVEHGIKKLRHEGQGLQNPQAYVVWEAGVITVSSDNVYSICGCRQALFYGKRRAQEYDGSGWTPSFATMTCPATMSSTTLNGETLTHGKLYKLPFILIDSMVLQNRS